MDIALFGLLDYTLLSWVLFVALIGIVGLIEENELPVPAFITFIVGLTGLQYFTDLKPWTYVYENPWYFLLYVVIYIVAGIIWSHVKWVLYLREIKNYHPTSIKEAEAHALVVEKRNEDYRKTHPNYVESTVDVNEKAIEYTTKKFRLRSLPPKASEKKTRITSWLMYWPISMFWTVVDKFVVNLFNNLFELIRASYQRVSDKMFADFTTK
ncbi:hypothetical protein EVB32_218 [Rhizobium phage RHph_TM39]|uniref:Uncharacterized protein n=1 Tax=Rhizobium phage RHph_TM30 TaxID=2509764 RepID=A0A7S5RFZ1_9CAUD|nr:hypothetical protein PQC16_gp232 [Rhizobium phage RHph_TM30]QIG71703.1 hypothetical protein EVB94_232 [Rhizobium phage RHph_TM40]QIG72066.1 hypothetical protein EVB95_232 [Rhizobium phage RHph_TM2_3B]QIG72428.1 hypothetical protein EVB96_232 [Rhizobium phage RHph_TM3_3_6]QIG77206.1 hypothetical protein EVB32_218 [Rhizobium phage RHph_TM39]QIG71339.1 hypothetical protein EVB93_232 [Rhizobium phage RHph_TM30]